MAHHLHWLVEPTKDMGWNCYDTDSDVVPLHEDFFGDDVHDIDGMDTDVSCAMFGYRWVVDLLRPVGLIKN